MEKIVSDFIQFEANSDVFNKKINHLKFWSYVRFSIFWSFYSEEYFDGREFSKFKLIKKYLSSFFLGFINLIRLLPKKYDILILNTSRRSNLIDKKNVDVYTYPFINNLNKKYKILLLDISKFKNTNVYPCDFLPMRFASILNRIFSFLFTFTEKDKNYLNDVELSLNKFFKKDINSSKIIMREIIRHKIEYRVYKIIFKLFSPRILVYTNNGVIGGIIQAANELGVKTIELQHGGISHLHIAYNSDKFDQKVLPSYFFSFGEYWNDAVKFKTEKINIGFPYMEYLESALPKDIQRKNDSILVISKGKFERNLFVEITEKLLNSLQDFDIYYKLNPSEYDNWREYYPASFQKNPNLKIIDNNEKSLNYFYKKTKYLIGSGSTCIYEGVVNDMIVFVIKSLYFTDAKKLINNNSLFLASNANEILSKIKNGEVPSGRINKEYMFKRCTSDSINKNIHKIFEEIHHN